MLHFWTILLCFTWIGAVPLTEVMGLESRIFEGEIANSLQFPWQAAIFNGNFSVQNFWCGGSLINDRWILTAGHCIRHPFFGQSQPVVFLGSTSLLNDPTNSKKNFSDVESYVHPNVSYKINELGSLLEVPKNDIALIKLRTPVKFNDNIPNIRNIILANEELPLGSKVVASGWGMTADEAWYSEKLLFANMTTFSCDAEAEAHGYLCATGVKPRMQHVCFHDSGGPLVFYNATGTPILVGVTSFTSHLSNETLGGKGTCGSAFYGFFINAYKFSEWIYKTINEHPH